MAVRALVLRAYDETHDYAEFAGASSDTKPTAGLVTGSRFQEADTGKKFLFDELTAAWYDEGNASKTSIAGAVVTLGSALAYDGTELTQEVSTVVLGETTLTSGTDYTVINNKATLPGTYTLRVAGIGSYAGVVLKEFTVDKGTGAITPDPNSLSLTEGGDAGTSTITVTGDGVLSVSVASEAVATAELEDTTVTVTPVGEGSTTVTVSMAATSLWKAATATISVTVEAAPDPDPDSEPSEP